jgi:hypothetical protein
MEYIYQSRDLLLFIKGVSDFGAEVMSTKSQSKSDSFVEILPNAARTFEALRELGYASVRAIGDLVDNSINAKATNVLITIRQIGQSHIVDICDDGKGMDRDQLIEALRLGSETKHDQNKSLGKYGMGLKTASLAFARTIQVLTRKEKAVAYEGTLDLNTVARENRFVAKIEPANTARVLSTIGDRGTMVTLTNCDRLDDTNVSRLITKLRDYLGQTFRNFIKDGLVIKLSAGPKGKTHIVPAIDPLMREHELTEVRFNKEIDLGGKRTAHLTIVELPDLGPVEEVAANIVPQNSGFYIVRNRREIMGAQTLGMYKHHHSYSHFRAELSFTGELDSDFHVDVTKSNVTPNDQLQEKIISYARKFIEQSGREGKERTVVKTTLLHSKEDEKAEPKKKAVAYLETDHGTPDVMFKADNRNGNYVINYNKRNPLIQVIAEVRSRKVTDIFDRMCLAIAKMDGPKAVEKFNAELAATLAQN